jgi:hypothetical protein
MGGAAMTRPLSKPIRAALATGRVRTLTTARALLARGWIEALPEQTGVEHIRATGEHWAAVTWTPEGQAARAMVRPLLPTPDRVVAMLRGEP